MFHKLVCKKNVCEKQCALKLILYIYSICGSGDLHSHGERILYGTKDQFNSFASNGVH